MLSGLLELYGRTPSQLTDVFVTTDLISLEGGAPLVSGAADLQPLAADDAGPSRAATVALPLTNVSPGEYLVRATVRRGGEALAEVLRDVSVHPTDPRESREAAQPAFDPGAVLGGELARGLIEALDAHATGGPLKDAAHAAMTGRWEAIDAALAVSMPATADVLTLRGVAAFARGDYGAAASMFRSARDAGSVDAALAFVLGWSYAAAGDDRAAVTAWRGGLLLNTKLIPPYLALADAYVRLGQPMLARQVVLNGLEAVPGSAERLDRLSRLEGR
jgi:hypothetical protein